MKVQETCNMEGQKETQFGKLQHVFFDKVRRKMDEAIKRILNVFSILQRAKTAILRGKTMHFGGSVVTNLKCVFLAHCDVK